MKHLIMQLVAWRRDYMLIKKSISKIKILYEIKDDLCYHELTWIIIVATPCHHHLL